MISFSFLQATCLQNISQVNILDAEKPCGCELVSDLINRCHRAYHFISSGNNLFILKINSKYYSICLAQQSCLRWLSVQFYHLSESLIVCNVLIVLCLKIHKSPDHPNKNCFSNDDKMNIFLNGTPLLQFISWEDLQVEMLIFLSAMMIMSGGSSIPHCSGVV